MPNIFERLTDAFKTKDEAEINRAVQAAATAGSILQAVGGAENVVSARNCATRLRLVVKDTSKIDSTACMKAGAIGVVIPEDEENGVHVVMGTGKAQYVGDAFQRLL